MPKLSLLTLLAAFVCVPLHAQTPDYRFGKVSADELSMTSYDKDPEAEAVYLNEESNLYYQIGNNITITRDYRARIKILKPEGTDQANISLTYIDNFNLRETITGIDAAAYNLVDGKIVKTPLKKQYIFTEQIDENRKLIKFSIPEVREGTVIEYKYRWTSINYTYIPTFRFQHDIPVMRSRMEAAMPEFFRFNIAMKGYVRIDVNETASTGMLGSGSNSMSYTIRNITTSATDIPALKHEEYVWCLNDFRSTLDFELSQIAFPYSPVKNYTTTWKDVNEALRKSTFQTHCRIGNPYKDEVAAIKAAEGTPEQKIVQILRLVQSKIKWNEEYRLFSKGPRAAAGKGNGSSADINFVLMAALKDAGFETVPVLLSPRYMGRLPYTHATIDGINAFILRVALGDGAYAYLDGTNPNSSLNLLPTQLLVDRARIFGVDDQSGWCDLTDLVKNASVVNMILKLNEDNTLSGTFIQQDANQAALGVSTAYTNAKSQEEYVESLEKEHGIQIEEFEIEGVGTNMVVQKYRATVQPPATDQFVYINATVVPFMSTNKLNAQSRALPVEFPLAINYGIRCTLELPEGYTVEEMPRNINLSAYDNGVSCRYVRNTSGQYLQFNFQFALKRILYLPDEFEELNTFYGLVADLSNSQLVIRKKRQQ